MTSYKSAMRRSHSRSPTPRGKPGTNATLERERDQAVNTRPGDNTKAVRDKKPVTSSDPATLQKTINK